MNDVVMIRLLLAAFATVALAGAPAEGRSEYRLGGADGNGWATALSGGGEYLNFDDREQPSPVPVAVVPFSDLQTKLVDFPGTSMGPVFVSPDVNLVEIDVDENGRLLLPFSSGEINVDSACWWLPVQRSNAANMFDGDPATASFFSATHLGGGRLEKIHPIIDFRGALPINRIRFYPRLGQRDDLDLIRSLESSHSETEFALDSFSKNLLGGYEIRVGGDHLPFLTSPCDPPIASKRLPHRSDPLMAVVAMTEENLNPVVDLTFPPKYVRWMYFEPLPKEQFEVAEFEVFGEGFVEEMIYRTPILDFGRRVNWSKIRWSGDFPFGTATEIRTRTGNAPDPNLYFAPDGNGTPIQISRESYESIETFGIDQTGVFVAAELLPTVYDSDNWSFWSPAYEIEPGRRDSSLAPEAWVDGTPLIVLGSTRYLQLEVRMFSRFDVSPRLDQIAIQFSENPAAQDVVAEIWPTEVESFEANTFTYVIKPTFEADNTGFDRLEILTHARADTVRSVKVDDLELLLSRFPPRIEDDRIVVPLPFREADPDSSLKRIEVVFDVEVLRFGTHFTGWIYDSNDPDLVKQRIRPGNADFRFSGDDLSVRTPIGGDLVVGIAVAPNPFTPNGDGVNDRAAFSYKLREVTAAREVRLEVYDLVGGLVYRVGEPSTHGEKQLSWNGRTNAGDLVAPGTYLYRLRLDVEDPEDHIGTVTVAY